MSIIRVLKEEISNRIAAGEVIERPASVVKELVDNAIDSGANRIFVHIEKAGSRTIQVTDNGSGMDKDDAMLCLEAHATSKIINIEDLDSIATFGFRGEAIPSIASVSRFEINTRKHDSIEGTKVLCEGGTIKTVEAAGCPPGTSISVKNLFYNVPARKKFLRSAATEEAHIHETALLLALSRMDIFMELKFDNRVVFSVPAADNLRTRASLLFGRELVNEMLPVNYAEAGIMITGLIARPGVTRNTRKEQRVFVNGRPVDAATIYMGIKDAYEGMVVKGRHAPCLLYFVMDPSRVDINVHPAKREVRFKENHLLGKITAAAVSQALRGLSGSFIQVSAPSFMEKETVEEKPQETFEQAKAAPSIPSIPVPDLSKVTKPVFTAPAVNKAVDKPLIPKEVTPSPAPTEEEVLLKVDSNTIDIEAEDNPVAQKEIVENVFEDIKVIGQYSSRYILAENSRGLIMFSIRSARERILFEKLQQQIKDKTADCQFLLLPISIELSPADTRLVNKYIDNIKAVGFEVEPFGGNTFVISAIPASFPDENINGVFFDILDQLRDNPRELKKQADNFLLKAICKSAMRLAGKSLADEEIKHLITSLGKTKMPYSCPEGRPTVIHFSNNELLRRFGRKD
ncbi:MAG: DNA mismatch repair endonuclease MutL [Lentisphaeraceae bacterium]|nr:DNA mismatch repair endonuclease MutL [Lentisphaeraceae bacterium]